MIDANSQQVLYQKNATKKLYPASTTKIMTMILLFEAIQEKRLKWDDILTCSAYASSMGGSQVYLEENETMSVFELFKMYLQLLRLTMQNTSGNCLYWNVNIDLSKYNDEFHHSMEIAK